MKKTKKGYLELAFIMLGLFLTVFLCKKIYPFGHNTLIVGDMFDQIVAFFYHLYDVVKGTDSLFIDFATSGSVNFFGVFTYYLTSPINLLILFFPRSNIYQAISLIIAFKIMLSGFTMLYTLNYYSKKTPHYIRVMLALLYAFSGYTFVSFQIIGWLDILYLFPLMIIALKKTLDGEKSYFYAVCIALSVVYSFYLTTLLLLLFALYSYFYLKIFDEKHLKERLVNLGIGTLFGLLLGGIVLLPSLFQLTASSRMAIDLNKIFNSKYGDYADKVAYFITSGIGLVYAYLNYKEFRKDKNNKFLKLYFTSFILMFIPIIIEPVNLMLHFGSYAFFSFRTGFIPNFVLILGILYYYENYSKEKKITSKEKRNLIITIGVFFVLLLTIIGINYSELQRRIATISLGKNDEMLKIVLTIIILTFITTYIILKITDFKTNKYSQITMLVLTTILTGAISYTYFCLEFDQRRMTGQYESMIELSKIHKEDDYYRVKSIYPNLVMNHGMVTNFHTIDHFTSLTSKNNIEFLKSLGYSSFWTKTYSIGGTLFSDSVLANKYLISDKEYNNIYYEYLGKYKDIYLYQNNLPISYGYLVKTNYNLNTTSALQMQNALYQSLSGDQSSIITLLENDFTLENIEYPKTEKHNYKIIDKTKEAYLEKEIYIKDKTILYFGMQAYLDNMKNKEILDSVDIYINDELYLKNFTKRINNGLQDLGTYEEETVKIKIVLHKNLSLEYLELGYIDLNKYESFLRNNKIDLDIKYHSNKIDITYEAEEDGILFLPITYSTGYELLHNNEYEEIIILYDNFIGLRVNKGLNTYNLSYISPGVKMGVIITFMAALLMLLVYNLKIDHMLVNNKIIQKIIGFIYPIAVFIAMLVIYILPILVFIGSFFIKYKF